jgi:DNA-binding PadR family transcriptional regulator
MSKTADKRRRADLDLFVLALIESGLTTPYEFQKFAGISQGASIPALRRLVKAGYVHQGRPGVRRRKDYRVTLQGEATLRNGWQDLVKGGPSGDPDSDLRVALLALRSGQRSVAVSFLIESTEIRLAAAQTIESLQNLDDAPRLARSYRELRYAVTKAQVMAESKALRTIAGNLPRSSALNTDRRGRS